MKLTSIVDTYILPDTKSIYTHPSYEYIDIVICFTNDNHMVLSLKGGSKTSTITEVLPSFQIIRHFSFLVTLTQSFRCTHRVRICVCVFIGVSVCAY
jgi:hypothetical protein